MRVDMLRAMKRAYFFASFVGIAFAAIYFGIGALVGAFVSGLLEGSLLVILVFSLDAFSLAGLLPDT